MNIPHNALVAVADGAKFLLFRNQGDDARINLQVAHHSEGSTAQTHEIGTDAPGTSHSSVGPGRSSMENPDYQQQNEDRFAGDAVELLNKLALENWYDHLVIVAAPKALGAMRPKYHKQLEAKLLAEIAKELAHAPTPDIEKALAAYDA